MDSELSRLRPELLVEIDCLDPSRFVKNSDISTWASYDQLAAMQGHASNTASDKLQKASGSVLDDNGVLAHTPLRDHFGPVSSMTFDWQHTFLSNGVASE